MPRRRLKRQPNSASATIIIPNEMIIEVISWLSVKHLMQFRCVNKFFKSLISDPHFVQMHLKKSEQNPHLALMWKENMTKENIRIENMISVITYPISLLLKNMNTTLRCSKYIFGVKIEDTTIPTNPYYQLDEYYYNWRVVGSCNGLLCLIDVKYRPGDYFWLCLWNPAMRVKSKKVSVFLPGNFKFSFGYDESSKTYKVVAFGVERGNAGNETSVVKVLSLGDNSWRNIQYFPVLPLYSCKLDKNNGVYLSGTINWLALRNDFYSDYGFGNVNSITVERYVIVSLDLSTELYTELLLPRGFDEVPRVHPTLVSLMGCLYVCHHFKGSHFAIWKMKDFGVHESWVQLFKIGYQNFHLRECLLGFETMEFLPLYISEKDDTLVFANDENDATYIYNCRDNRSQEIRITNKIWWMWAKDYVESLVSTH